MKMSWMVARGIERRIAWNFVFHEIPGSRSDSPTRCASIKSAAGRALKIKRELMF